MNAIADDIVFNYADRVVTFKGSSAYSMNNLSDHLHISFGDVLIWVLSDLDYTAHKEYGTVKPKANWLRRLWWRIRRRSLMRWWVGVGRYFNVSGKDIRLNQDALAGPVPIENFINWLAVEDVAVEYKKGEPVILKDGLNIDEAVAVQLCEGSIVQKDGEEIYGSIVVVDSGGVRSRPHTD
jgi:hypothetical protein